MREVLWGKHVHVRHVDAAHADRLDLRGGAQQQRRDTARVRQGGGVRGAAGGVCGVRCDSAPQSARVTLERRSLASRHSRNLDSRKVLRPLLAPAVGPSAECGDGWQKGAAGGRWAKRADLRSSCTELTYSRKLVAMSGSEPAPVPLSSPCAPRPAKCVCADQLGQAGKGQDGGGRASVRCADAGGAHGKQHVAPHLKSALPTAGHCHSAQAVTHKSSQAGGQAGQAGCGPCGTSRLGGCRPRTRSPGRPSY